MQSTSTDTILVPRSSSDDSTLPLVPGYSVEVGELIRELSRTEAEARKRDSRPLPARRELYEYD